MKAKPTGSHYREMADFRALKTSKQRSGHPEFRVLQDSWCEEHCSRWGDMTPRRLLPSTAVQYSDWVSSFLQ